jgi:hypothetical protein
VTNEKFNTIMPETTDRELCVMVDKPVSAEGYRENFLPRAEKMIAQFGELRFLVYFKKYQGWEEEAAMMDFAATHTIGNKIRRFAIVNPPQKYLALHTLRSPMLSGETRIFSETELQDAITWVKG